MPAMTREMVSTTNELAGFRIVRQLGVVRGITVRSRSVIGNIGAALQTLVGGNITLYTELCERAREDAFELMIRARRRASVRTRWSRCATTRTRSCRA